MMMVMMMMMMIKCDDNHLNLMNGLSYSITEMKKKARSLKEVWLGLV
jgi:hypothetical protein